jgi:DNA-binding Xre family transcriptional regulator
MVKVTIINNIDKKINEHKKLYGTTKVWVAEQIGITRQSLNILINTKNPTIESLEKVAFVLKCDVKDLYECNIAYE